VFCVVIVFIFRMLTNCEQAHEKSETNTRAVC